MDKYIFIGFTLRNETVTSGIVKPFNCAYLARSHQSLTSFLLFRVSRLQGHSGYCVSKSTPYTLSNYGLNPEQSPNAPDRAAAKPVACWRTTLTAAGANSNQQHIQLVAPVGLDVLH